jgi:two-component system, chemotaxis family, CheB/CheR fusion protein
MVRAKTTPAPSKATSKRVKTAPPTQKEPAPFPIVGIGASAGGLEAMSELLQHLPERTGMAYVIVQHLDPSHGSMMPDILGRTTRMPVSEVRDGDIVQPDHVYVIPANTRMQIRNGALQLSARVLVRGRHLPIDDFLLSLAEERGNQAIGVILSGAASDGTEGCAAIKASGGITFAQDEQSAKYGSMPRSAIAAGWIDFALPPKKIAQELARIGRHPYVARAPLADAGLSAGTEMEQLLALIREASGVDFTHYKQSTLQRRIKRRIVLLRLHRLKDYLRYIKAHPAELDELFKDILIHVTGFFRDPEAFEALRKLVLPPLFENRKEDEGPIRIWVPGCSTGEEVYSIAIVLLEYLWERDRKATRAKQAKTVQIFATDISESALDRARGGLYTEAAVAQVSPERLKKFFFRLDGGYQINKPIRDMCIFAKQNLAKDPPFSNLDLVSCRNLLIYLGPELQKRVIPTLHYALRPNGYLMLGGSEGLGTFADYFTQLDKRHRIYQKKRTAARLVTYFTEMDRGMRKPAESRGAKAVSSLMVDKEVEHVLFNRYVPASVVVNAEMEIVQFRGKTGPYLEPPSGQPTFSLSRMAREGLLVDLQAALARAKKTNGSVRKEGVRVKSNGGTRAITLEVIPVRGQGTSERFYVVVFQEQPGEAEATSGVSSRARKPTKKLASMADEKERLERNVADLREQLQALLEDHETTREEFRSANEEVLSANEELQSTNEELETAKEELQSSNEELTTLNEELQSRNAELSAANNDLLNLLGNVSVPVVMVGNDLRIRRFTPPAQQLLNLIPADIGRRLGEIRPNLEIDDLEELVRASIDGTILGEREVRQKEGGWYLARVRPYKTWDNRIDGAVISFQDVEAFKQRMGQSHVEFMLDIARVSMLILGPDLRVMSSNPVFCRTFQVTRGETEGRFIYELGNGQWDIPELRSLLEKTSGSSAPIKDFEVVHDFPQIGRRRMLLNAGRNEVQPGLQQTVLSIEDVTEPEA